MGKLTLAKIIASEIGVEFKIVSVKTLKKFEDIARILANLSEGSFLIIEQIEEIRKPLLEVIIKALSDSLMDIVIDSGPSARSVQIKLPNFTLISTTTKPSQIDKRLYNLMFAFNFNPYNKDEILKIIFLSAIHQEINVDREAADLLAEQCNRCPGEVPLILKKVHRYAIAYADGTITSATASDAIAMFAPNNNAPIFVRQPIPDDVKMFVWQRDKGFCTKCGSNENLEYDHIIPVSKGGSSTARNIQLLCEKCNRSKNSNII
jgi:Holliday junction DNA helicase RuvB